ncbi:hypothetical protein K1719_047346 [Acacia pycnantha]|nr:hypothetical protein K1719_047346 [Acacia pycnantha]
MKELSSISKILNGADESPKGFKLEFYYVTNPYFKNYVRTKTYHMIDEDEPIRRKAIGLRNFRTRWSKTMILGEEFGDLEGDEDEDIVEDDEEEEEDDEDEDDDND